MKEWIRKETGILELAVAVLILLPGIVSAANLDDNIGVYKTVIAFSNGQCVAKYSGVQLTVRIVD